MNLALLKEKLIDSIDVWTDTRIDEMVKGSPMLAIPSVYMKRATHNIISKNKDKWNKQVDNAALFIADENGDIDTETIFADMMQMLKVVESYQFDFGIIHGHIADGMIYIDLPDNLLTTILFGSKKCITLTEEDFVELKDLLITK